MLTDAYAAGLFDGEGSVVVSFNKVHNAYSLVTTVTNNHRGILDQLVEAHEGAVGSPSNPNATSFGKTAWTWTVVGPKALRFLTRVLPFAVIKRAQVEEALKFPLGARGKRPTNAQQLERLRIRRELQRLKGEIQAPQAAELASTRRELNEWPKVQVAVRLYREGKSARVVAAEVGEHSSTVAYWLRMLGETRSRSAAVTLSSRKDSITARPEVARAVALYDAGHSVGAVARQVGSKPATVNYWLKQLGKTRTLAEAQRLRRA